VEVSFKLPIMLPATVALSTSGTAENWHFALHDARSGRPHLTGQLNAPELQRPTS
jgi:hypothetical protein